MYLYEGTRFFSSAKKLSGIRVDQRQPDCAQVFPDNLLCTPMISQNNGLCGVLKCICMLLSPR